MNLQQMKEVEGSFPLQSFTGTMLRTKGAVDRLRLDMVERRLDQQGYYPVIHLQEFARMGDAMREKMLHLARDGRIQGARSKEELEEILGLRDTRTVDGAAEHIADLYASPGAEAEEREAHLDELTEAAYAESAAKGASANFDLILNDDYACVLLECDNHKGFAKLPRLGPQQAEALAGVETACRVYLDMSKSMGQDGRAEYARALAGRIDRRLEERTFAAATEVWRFATDVAAVARAQELVLAADGRTATGAALKHAGAAIAQGAPGALAYLTLITDGIPTVGGTVDGAELDPLEYAVRMAAALPANAKLVLVALAPVDPADGVRLRAYLGYVKRLCEAAPYGQAVVVCRRQEKRLSELVLGAQMKVRQIEAFGELYGAGG